MYDLTGTEGKLHFLIYLIKTFFTDAWEKIGNTLVEQNFSNGVVGRGQSIYHR